MEPSYRQPSQPKSSWPKYVGLGCLAVIALAVIGGLFAYYGIRSAISGVVAKYSSENPLTLPEVQLPDPQLSELTQRIDDFGEALDAGRPAQPLVLTESEINALIQRGLSRNKAGRDGVRAYVRIIGSRLEGDISVPLHRFGGDLQGRYFNGKARISVGVVGNRLVAHLEDLKVGDDYVPDQFRERFSRENLLKDAYADPDTRRFLTRLESIEIGDGKVVLIPQAILAPQSIQAP